VSDFIFVGLTELFIIIFLAVHCKDNVDVFSGLYESFSVVLSNSLFDGILLVDHNLFEVSLIVPSVLVTLQRLFHFTLRLEE